MKQFTIIFSIFILAIILGCADTKSSQEKKKDGEKRGEIIPVEAVTISKGDISSHLIFSSTVESEHEVSIFPQTSGIVKALYVEEGDLVQAGDSLAQLENDLQKLSVAKARQDYEQKSMQFKRVEDLYNRKLSSQQEYENARFTLEQARLVLEESLLNLQYTTIHSPINGIITQRAIHIGDRITPSSLTFTVINPEELIVPVWVPEKEYAVCSVGMKAFLETPVYPDVRFEGWIKRINPAVDASSGTFKVVVGINDPSRKIRKGMFVNVYIVVEEHRNVPILPKDALVYDDERRYVFLVKDSLAIKKAVKLGFEDAMRAEVLKGVDLGDTIITVGQSGLRDSSNVKITKLLSDG